MKSYEPVMIHGWSSILQPYPNSTLRRCRPRSHPSPCPVDPPNSAWSASFAPAAPPRALWEGSLACPLQYGKGPRERAPNRGLPKAGSNLDEPLQQSYESLAGWVHIFRPKHLPGLFQNSWLESVVGVGKIYPSFWFHCLKLLAIIFLE